MIRIGSLRSGTSLPARPAARSSATGVPIPRFIRCFDVMTRGGGVQPLEVGWTHFNRRILRRARAGQISRTTLSWLGAGGRCRRGFPLGLLDLQLRMRHEAVPDDGLEGFRMRRDERGIDGGNDDYMVADLFRVAAAAPDNAKNFQAAPFAFVERVDEVGADVALGITAADGKHE